MIMSVLPFFLSKLNYLSAVFLLSFVFGLGRKLLRG